jgi:hypothetical protein
VYFSQGFGGTLRSLRDTSLERFREMKSGKAPQMIWVAIDESSPAGTSEFVDSANNGPWGRSVTTELIPDLERHYRMDATPSGRLLTGHSSGAWAALWLQINYPEVFGGAWPTSPDPSDFHDFLGVDLYSKQANFYFAPDHTPRPFAIDKGNVLVTLRDYARRESVIGEFGGQFSSFEWVFSPRGPDGRPLHMFDRETGEVDGQVAEYWSEHFDIAEYLRRNWAQLRFTLDGKIHLIVGAADNFGLDKSAQKLEAIMKMLDAHSDFRYINGRGHFDLYATDGDKWGLYKMIAREMYAVARPGSANPEGGHDSTP